MEFVWPEDLPGVSVLMVDDVARKWSVAHTTYTVCTGLAIDRPAKWRYRQEIHEQPADGISLMEPGEMHTNTVQTDLASFRVLFLEPGVMERAALELDSGTTPHFRFAQTDGRRHPELRLTMLAFHESIETAATTLERQSRLLACLRLLFEQTTEDGPHGAGGERSPSTVERAREYIEAHLAEAISLDQLAIASGAGSRFQLVRSFTRTVGVPPHSYQLNRRISRARDLLLGGERPAAVASELGFADQSHLTRHFTRSLGVPPGAFARAAVRARTF